MTRPSRGSAALLLVCALLAPLLGVRAAGAQGGAAQGGGATPELVSITPQVDGTVDPLRLELRAPAAQASSAPAA